MKTKEENNFFENMYAESQGDESKIPWAQMKTDDFLKEYLKSNKCEGKAIVIGCGLGDDAIALEMAGFDVTAIDISETAIKWAKERFNESNVDFRVQDIFKLPREMLAQYDFVFESRTIQSLAIELRDEVIKAISSLMSPKAKILVVANAKDDGEKTDGPPWPLESKEVRYFSKYGCEELEFDRYEVDSSVSRFKFRALYKKVK